MNCHHSPPWSSPPPLRSSPPPPLSVTSRCLDDFTAVKPFWNGPRGQFRGKDSPASHKSFNGLENWWVVRWLELTQVCSGGGGEEGGEDRAEVQQQQVQQLNQQTPSRPGRLSVLLDSAFLDQTNQSQHWHRLCTYVTKSPQYDR